MKKTLSHIGLVSIALLSTSAHAADQWPNWYIGVSGGMGWVDDSLIGVRDTASPNVSVATVTGDSGFVGTAALGYKPQSWSMARVELEYAYRTNGNDTANNATLDGDLVSHAGMANLYLDFSNPTIFTPYVGGGIGMANIEFDNGQGISVDDTVLAWQFMGGLSYEPTSLPSTIWNVGYRYFDTQNFEYNIPNTTFVAEQGYQHHGVELGAKLRF